MNDFSPDLTEVTKLISQETSNELELPELISIASLSEELKTQEDKQPALDDATTFALNTSVATEV